GEVAALMGEAGDDQLDDRARLLVVARRHERQRRSVHRERPHTSRTRALVAVEAEGIVVGAGGKDDRAAVADRLDRELRAHYLLLDQNGVPAPGPRQQAERVLA